MKRNKLDMKSNRKILDEFGAMYDLFSKNVPHPNGANLFFYPENYNARKDDLSKYSPTIEEVVDKALSYKPIQL